MFFPSKYINLALSLSLLSFFEVEIIFFIQLEFIFHLLHPKESIESKSFVSFMRNPTVEMLQWLAGLLIYRNDLEYIYFVCFFADDSTIGNAFLLKLIVFFCGSKKKYHNWKKITKHCFMYIEIFFFLFLCPCLLCRQLTKKKPHDEFLCHMQNYRKRKQMKIDMNEINIDCDKNFISTKKS